MANHIEARIINEIYQCNRDIADAQNNIDGFVAGLRAGRSVGTPQEEETIGRAQFIHKVRRLNAFNLFIILHDQYLGTPPILTN
jgi:hypothetical protein